MPTGPAATSYRAGTFDRGPESSLRARGTISRQRDAMRKSLIRSDVPEVNRIFNVLGSGQCSSQSLADHRQKATALTLVPGKQS